ncbi:MAG: RND transporter [Gammaproteobacteria bacterium]|nr:MAG: RND transporter [Gammaproteobacteria bacterium]
MSYITIGNNILNKNTRKRYLFRTLSIVAIALLNNACTTLGPDYKRPSMTLPDHYKEAAQQAHQATKSTSVNNIDVTAQWWQVYSDELLNNLLAQVEVDNYALQAVAARAKQARALFDISKAQQSPTVFVGGRNDFGLVATWEVDLWGRIQREVEASDATAQANIADYAAAKLSLQAQLAQNYFLLRVKDADIALLQSTLNSYQQSLQITKNKYAMGVLGRIDVAQAQAQLSTTQVQMHNVAVNRTQLEHAIALLLGKTPADFSIKAAEMHLAIPTMPIIPDDLPANLLIHRPDIAAAERRMAAASAQIGVAAAAAYPALELVAGISIRKIFLGGGELFAPIYTAGGTKATNSQAEAAYVEVVANYRQTVLNGFREVEDNLSTLRILSQAAKAQHEAVKASRKVVEISKNKYQAGVIDHQSIIIEQAFALNNERSALSILARRLVASVDLIKALGGGWQADVLSEKQGTAKSKE